MQIEFIKKWKTGQIRIIADSLEELSDVLEQLRETKNLEEIPEISEEVESTLEIPAIPGNLGCSDAIKEILKSSWGKAQPRDINEIIEAMKTSGIFYPQTTVSGTLTRLTKNQTLRRTKQNKKWVYVYLG